MQLHVRSGTRLVLALAALLLTPACLAITQEDTSLSELGSHDGMYFFNGALRKTVPPNATSGSPDSVAAAAVGCGCR